MVTDPTYPSKHAFPMVTGPARSSVHAIAALVLNFHQKNRTLRFLHELVLNQEGLSVIHIVDNSEPHELQAEDFREFAIPFHLLVAGKNLGVAGGRNAGITHALEVSNWEYLAMLDNDLTIPRNALNTIAGAFQHVPRTGIGSCWVVSDDQPAVGLAAGGDILPTFYPRYRRRPRVLGPHLSDAPYSTSFVQGGATLYSRELLERGLRFDNRFNPYGPEDIDFCFAARRSSFQIIIVPSVRIVHEGHGAYKTSIRHQRRLAAGETLLRLKWASHPYISVSVYTVWKLARAVFWAPWRDKYKIIVGLLAGVCDGLALMRGKQS